MYLPSNVGFIELTADCMNENGNEKEREKTQHTMVISGYDKVN